MSILHRVVKVIGRENEGDYAEFDRAVTGEMRQVINGSVVLETGGGTGDEARGFLDHFGAKQVIISDLSFGLLLAAKQHCPQALVVQADSRYLPFADGCVDVVYSNCMYHHIEPGERKSALSESLRIARRTVLLKEIAGFSNSIVNALYVLYYSVVDGSAYRPTAKEWLDYLAPYVKRNICRPSTVLVYRYVFFVLDPSAEKNQILNASASSEFGTSANGT
jgi:ubiquinone/menaquinone biosynthesis C-methylase UbiE